MKSAKNIVTQLLETAGITINGANAFDIKILDEKFYELVFEKGSIGLAEAYYKNQWTTTDLCGFFHRLFLSKAESFFSESFGMKTEIIGNKFPDKIIPPDVISKEVTKENWLENIFNSLIITSSGYWQEVYSLEAAQQQKFWLICEKLKLSPGDTILDLSCGRGSFAHFAAKNYKVKVIGLTTSNKQSSIAKKICKGLNVEIRNNSIMAMAGQYNKIVGWNLMDNSVQDYQQLLKKIDSLLHREGICLLNLITGENNTMDPWINEHIFPETLIPSIYPKTNILPENLVLEDLQNFGLHFDTTIANWQLNLKEEIRSKNSGKNSLMWNYFLACYAASFRARRLDVAEIVLTAKENPFMYEPMRFYQKNTYE